MAKAKSKKKFDANKKKEEPAKIRQAPTGKNYPGLTVKSFSKIILLAIFLFSFYIRGITPIKNVFNRGVVGFAMDDSVFQMRLVENTIHFFPHRIFFDAFTLYPYGSQISWGPIFDQMIAFFGLIGGVVTNNWNPAMAGMPAQSVIDTVGAFFPAVLGALIVFPVYVIGKEVLNEKAGLIGAFLIAILPGQFLSRSVLGFTDHHVAEAFFTTLMMMFFVIAIKKAENITFDHWLNKDWATLKTPIIYSIFAGISFAAYLLFWPFGVFFAVVFAIFIIVQFIIDHFRGKSTEYLGVVGIIAYVVAMIMVLPYVKISNAFAPNYYSLLHLTVTGGAALVFAFLSLVSREMNKREYSGIHYLLFVLGTILIATIAIKIIMPDLYGTVADNWGLVFKAGGGLTIAEAMPTDIEAAVGQFGYNYYMAIIAILALGYYIFKKPRAEYTLLVVWSVFVLILMHTQNRFAYYYAVNVAILSGFIGSKILDYVDWKIFNSENIIENAKKIRVQHILSLALVIAVIGFLPVNASPFQITTQSAQWGAVDTSNGFYEWHDALTWMKDNTPVPDLPYYSVYEKPPQGQPYNYSKSDYGVMSWWDYGHIITYWGHRIPNANPFQAGIGGGSQHAPGASTFLIAQTEDEANAILDKLGINGEPGARYVVSNAYMAYAILTVFADWDQSDEGYYTQIQTNQGSIAVASPKYYNTMEAKLHIFDGDNLKSYRLVHETQINPQTRGGINEVGVYRESDASPLQPLCYGPCTGKFWYNQAYGGNLPLEYSGYAKIFEHVKGARITGRAPQNTTITLTNTIKTNIGRTVQYSQTTSSNGTYEFTVPYSTLGPIPGETNFDTKPEGPYNVTVGNVSKQIDVSEKNVLEGGTVTLNLT